MGGKGARKKGADGISRAPMTLREGSTGKKQGNVSAKTMCRIDHLKDLALWTATEASILPLGAFFGQRLAASMESVGARADPSLFFCERCESVLQPGQNCTVRIEKKTNKRHRRKKSNTAFQNSVVYNCHFCSHRNLMRGTPKGYIKEISPQKIKRPSRLHSANNVVETSSSLPKATPTIDVANKTDVVAFPIGEGKNFEPSSPLTPLPTIGLSLLDAKRRKRSRSSVKKDAETESRSTAADVETTKCDLRKRRRKSWTSLKEIALSAERDNIKKFTNLTVPFVI